MTPCAALVFVINCGLLGWLFGWVVCTFAPDITDALWQLRLSVWPMKDIALTHAQFARMNDGFIKMRDSAFSVSLTIAEIQTGLERLSHATNQKVIG